MQRLSGLDASFLYFETPTMHMHVCAAIIFDPSTVRDGYSFETIKEMIGSRLHLAAPLRRRLAAVPFNLHHPVWVEDGHFDLDYHVRRIGCPAPGTERQLAEIVGDIAGRPLDRTRPLWEVWVVEGLENGHVAAIAKMHHCTIDGVSGANLLVHFFDLEPAAPARPAPETAWEPETPPSDVELAAGALLARLAKPMQLARVVPKTLGIAGNLLLGRWRGRSSGTATPLTAPRTSFNAAITPHRRVAFARVPLDDVKAVKRAFDVKVNDVVLAVCAGALRRYLDSRGELPERSLTAVVPVSVRGDEVAAGGGSNRVSAMLTSLATDVDDPVERLLAIHRANRSAKEVHEAVGAQMLQEWAEFAAPNTFSLAARVYSAMRFAERHPVIHNLVISNVPGPRIPLWIAGARLAEMYPLGPVLDGAALNVTVLSYLDTLHWGLIACRETTPDLWDLAAAIPDALAELRKAAERVPRDA